MLGSSHRIIFFELAAVIQSSSWGPVEIFWQSQNSTFSKIGFITDMGLIMMESSKAKLPFFEDAALDGWHITRNTVTSTEVYSRTYFRELRTKTQKPDPLKRQALRAVYIGIKPLGLLDDFRTFRLEKPDPGFFDFLAA
jgi:hypothetical protein